MQSSGPYEVCGIYGALSDTKEKQYELFFL
jgi:hypothetical protein